MSPYGCILCQKVYSKQSTLAARPENEKACRAWFIEIDLWDLNLMNSLNVTYTKISNLSIP